jgi:hypothetical protein
MMPPSAPPVVPTTKLETAEHRLAQDLVQLARDLEQHPELVRFDETHVRIDERRVVGYRGLPCARVATGPHDTRWQLAEAYDRLAAAYANAGRAKLAAAARERAAIERAAVETC